MTLCTSRVVLHWLGQGQAKVLNRTASLFNAVNLHFLPITGMDISSCLHRIQTLNCGSLAHGMPAFEEPAED